MRRQTAALALVAAMTACGHSTLTGRSAVTMSVRPVASKASPSPLVEVRVGNVRAVFPKSWKAQMLPESRFPREGFIASPELGAWEKGGRGVQGLEAFWVNVDRLRIPSDDYYLAARNASFGQLPDTRTCGPIRPQIVANHPPDYSGRSFSPSDFVAAATGACLSAGTSTHWAYVVAAPGFGPARRVGIPTSGLYVVVAEVSGPRSAAILKEMMDAATFGTTTIGQIVQAAHSRVA